METKCDKKAMYRYTWPGRNEDFICEDHVGKLRRVAEVMGFHLHVIPIAEMNATEPRCSQIVTKEGER